MIAAQSWPTTGLPPSPAGWIITTARNRAIDRLRSEASRHDRHSQAALLHGAHEPGERGPVDNLLGRLGRVSEAFQAYDAAVELTSNAAERALLQKRRAAVLAADRG